MLLTRAPLNKHRITTQLVPCDLHVLNTPPAFVLSQNQTLRKKVRLLNLKKIHLDRTILSKFLRTLWVSFTPHPRVFQRPRDAQFNLFPLPSRPPFDPVKNGFFPEDFFRNLQGIPATGTLPAEPYCQRACFEGTKKPIGCCFQRFLKPAAFAPQSTGSLSRRPPSWRRGDPRRNGPPRSMHFVKVF